jgi:AraC-like DNA-binding protein
MDFEFHTRRPGPPLEPFVEAVWFARGQITYARERIAPTGSTVAVIVLGSPILQIPRNGAGEAFLATEGWLAGPHEGPVINAPTAETFAVGIVATPVGCRALFGVDPAPLRGRVVGLPAHLTALRGVLTAEPEPALAQVEASLAVEEVPGWRRCADAVAALEAEPRRSVAEIAAGLGVSHAHLDREFERVVGLTPTALGRILRLRRLLAALDVHGGVHWGALAAEWGWFDQSHFIRDFKRHTGVTPSAYVRAQRAAFAVGQAADGFVPEL